MIFSIDMIAMKLIFKICLTPSIHTDFADFAELRVCDFS